MLEDFFDISVVVWRKVEKYDKNGVIDLVLLKCKKHGVYEGWLDDDGWHMSACADYLDFPMVPQPKKFAYIPKQAKKGGQVNKALLKKIKIILNKWRAK